MDKDAPSGVRKTWLRISVLSLFYLHVLVELSKPEFLICLVGVQQIIDRKT